MSNALELDKFERLEWLPDDTPILVCENITLTWRELPWKKIERKVFKLQKRIYRASLSGNKKLVRKLQKTMVKSWYAKLLSVRRVTQENKGRNTAGVDKLKSLTPIQRIELSQNLKLDGTSSPTRRVWIPKPGKKEMRPLGIPTIKERAKQMLLKLALEPEWEAKFEINSYGFRPGRSCHDAIQAIFLSIVYKPKYVLDADISRCFDRINHSKLLEKLNTRPSFKRQIKAWLKSGVIDFSQWAERKGYNETVEGTPQGGVISPLLSNVALHGMETCIAEAFPSYENRRIKGSNKKYGHWVQAPSVIRYADDFVILCEELSIVQDCQEIISKWLKDIGLELKPSKTRLTHTLKEHNEEKPGFNFLGFTIRQFPKGKHHSGKHLKEILGHKTIVKPSTGKIQTHYETIADWCDRLKGESQLALISQLNPIIRGWCNYQSPWNSKEAFSKLEHLVWNRLWRWAKRRHPTKGKKWIARKYWQTIEGNKWTFATKGKNPMSLLRHPTFRAGDIWIKVQGNRTPFDGDWVYWSERMGEKYKVLDTQKARIVQRQKGKCAKCGHHFQPNDNLEKHHLILKRKGGKNADNNMVLLHLHCHDQIHALPEHEYENWVENKTAEIARANTQGKGKKRKPTKHRCVK
jgi:RNA-directed DNA polymerase